MRAVLIILNPFSQCYSICLCRKFILFLSVLNIHQLIIYIVWYTRYMYDLFLHLNFSFLFMLILSFTKGSDLVISNSFFYNLLSSDFRCSNSLHIFMSKHLLEVCYLNFDLENIEFFDWTLENFGLFRWQLTGKSIAKTFPSPSLHHPTKHSVLFNLLHRNIDAVLLICRLRKKICKKDKFVSTLFPTRSSSLH